ncbi:MAG TPA: SDR family oxidoreductase, partial [Dehalococcoidia bacterium]|nr:SDR family oxidoreductase [Dehalococcoidia bacterium]
MPVVLVTGCSSGFGELIAKTCAHAGHNVFATMRDLGGRNAAAAGALAAWARDERLQVTLLEMDVADSASVRGAVEQVFASAGRVDVVVNNAGIAAGGPLEAFDIEQMQALYDVNVWGPLRVDKAVLPQMRERRSGLLIHVTSTLGRILPFSGGLYPASKWAAEGLAESLHYQLKPFGVDVAILEPGSFPTPAVSKAMRPNDKAVAEAYAAVPPVARRAAEVPPDYKPPDPQEVADAVLRLIEMPAGKRPLRTVVGPIFTEGVEEYNRLY